MAEFDVHDIERRLKEYDERILRIEFDHRRGLHRIICWDALHYEEYVAMTVPAGQLDARVEKRMMEINPKHFNALTHLDKMRAAKERDEERKIENMAYGMADMLYKPLIRDALGA